MLKRFRGRVVVKQEDAAEVVKEEDNADDLDPDLPSIDEGRD